MQVVPIEISYIVFTMISNLYYQKISPICQTFGPMHSIHLKQKLVK